MRRRSLQANMRTCCKLRRLGFTFKRLTMLDSIDSSLYPSRFNLAFRALWCYIPERLLHYVRYLPLREYRRLRQFLDFSEDFSRDILRDRAEKHDGNDMMSVLLRASASENSTAELTERELISQITCVITFFLKMIRSRCLLSLSLHTVRWSLQGMRPPKLLNLVPLGGRETP